jgi:hypothetical protein
MQGHPVQSIETYSADIKSNIWEKCTEPELGLIRVTSNEVDSCMKILRESLPRCYRQQHSELEMLRKRLNSIDPTDYVARFMVTVEWAGYNDTSDFPSEHTPVNAKFPFYPYQFFSEDPDDNVFVDRHDLYKHQPALLSDQDKKTLKKAADACLQGCDLGISLRRQFWRICRYSISVIRWAPAPGQPVLLVLTGIRPTPSSSAHVPPEESAAGVTPTVTYRQVLVRRLVPSSITGAGASRDDMRTQYQAGFEDELRRFGEGVGWEGSHYDAMLEDVSRSLSRSQDHPGESDILASLRWALSELSKRAHASEAKAHSDLDSTSQRTGSNIQSGLRLTDIGTLPSAAPSTNLTKRKRSISSVDAARSPPGSVTGRSIA